MHRHQFQLATSGREDARKERRRSRHGDVYHVEGESYNADNVGGFCPRRHGGTPAPETDDSFSQGQPVDPASAKLVYLESMQALLRARLQPTWGRVQQQEEMEYELIVELVARLKRERSRMTRIRGTVLEEFEGFVDKFDGGVAHVTLKTAPGETFYGEYPAAELKAQGIREHRRFKC